MKAMLQSADFSDISIIVKENAADIIKGWMPGSGAEKYVTSVYVTASKPSCGRGLHDDVRRGHHYANLDACCAPALKDAGGCGPGV